MAKKNKTVSGEGPVEVVEEAPVATEPRAEEVEVSETDINNTVPEPSKKETKDGGETPASGEGGEPPASGEGGEPPASGEGGETPASEDGGETPASGDEAFIEEGKALLGMDAGDDPTKDEFAPLTDEEIDAIEKHAAEYGESSPE